MTILISLVSATMLCGYLVYDYAKNQKLEDTWAIYFLNLEQISQRLSKEFQKVYELKSNSQKSFLTRDVVISQPDYLARIKDESISKWVNDPFPGKLELPILTKGLKNLRSERLIFRTNGKSYLGIITSHNEASLSVGKRLKSGKYLLIYRMNLSKMIKQLYQSIETSRVYIVSRSGQLVYSGHKTIDRSYVQKAENIRLFIASPVNQGQFEFKHNNEDMYGFFQKIPGTNLVLFTELYRKHVLRRLDQGKDQYLTYLIVITAFTMIILQFIFSYLFSPIKSLSLDAVRLANGDFRQAVVVNGFGELRSLAKSFDTMRQRLINRDSELADLHDEKLIKERIEIELKVAKQLQDNFMHKILPSEFNFIAINELYQPANEIAGDWFSYFSNGEETYAVVADVSGHGIGSALFTSILSSLFVEHFIGAEKGSCSDFIIQIQKIFNTIGKGKIHATLTLIKVLHQDNEVRLYNCGHVPTFVIHKDKTVKPIVCPSNPLGLDLPLSVGKKRFFYKDPCRIFLYTDCLLEKHPKFRSKQLRQVLKEQADVPASNFIPKLYRKWQQGITDEIDDDLCMMLIDVKPIKNKFEPME